jgi:large subunit ribosomal protein L22
MNYMHIQKNLGHSPRKMRLVADQVRSLEPAAAVYRLQFVNKAAAIDLAKAIKSALANVPAGVSGVRFEKLEVNEGVKMKRFRAGTRGRIKRYVKKFSHVRIVLSDELIVPAEKKSKKVEPIIEAKEVEIEKGEK